MKRTLSLLFAITAAASLATAQNKLSGSATCPGKPGESHSIEVGDHPGHAYVISKSVCTWTKPFEIAGIKSKDHTIVGFQEIDGSKITDRSSAVGTMDNGDKYYVRAQGTSRTKDQKFEGNDGSWNFTGGTGKLKGLKGKGTYKCAPEGDNNRCDIIEGEYTLPSK